MKTLSLYQCEICGTKYNDEATAAACESGHLYPVRIVSAQFYPIKNDATGLPIRVVLEMPNGKRVQFKRC